MRVLVTICFFAIAVPAVSQTPIQWEFMGGPLSSITRNPLKSTNGSYYVLTFEEQGTVVSIKKTSTSDSTWEQCRQYKISNGYAALKQGPAGILFFFDGMKLRRSEDGGYFWEIIPSVPSPNGLAYSSDDEIYLSADDSLYVSKDLGKTWQARSSIAGYDSVIIDTEGRLYCVSNQGLIRSMDHGFSWDFVNLPSPLHRQSAVLIARNSALIVAANGTPYSSSDFGSTWSPMPAPPAEIVHWTILGNGTLVAAKKEDTCFYLVHDEDTWRSMSLPDFGGNSISALGSSEDDEVLISSNLGLYNYNPVNEKLTRQYYFQGQPLAITRIYELPSSTILVSCNSYGRYRFNMGTRDWSPYTTNYVLRHEFGAFAHGNDDVVFSVFDKQLLKSLDSGQTWDSVFIGDSWLYGSLVSDRTGRVYVAVNAGFPDSTGLYTTTDNGGSWTRTTDRNFYWMSLLIDPNDSIYVLRSPLYRSKPGGQLFTEVNTPSIAFSAMFISPNDILFYKLLNGLSYSSDHGITWNNANFNERYVMHVTSDSFGHIYIASGDCMYVGNSPEGPWIRMQTGLPPCKINAVLVGSDNRIYLGTSVGLYRSREAIPVTSVGHGYSPPSIEGLSLSLAYPNPVQQGTVLTVQYKQSQPGASQLVVYNVLGNEVYRSPVNYGSPSVNEIAVPTRSLSAGMYRYVIMQDTEMLHGALIVR